MVFHCKVILQIRMGLQKTQAQHYHYARYKILSGCHQQDWNTFFFTVFNVKFVDSLLQSIQKEEPTEGKRADRLLRRQDSWSNFHTGQNQYFCVEVCNVTGVAQVTSCF